MHPARLMDFDTLAAALNDRAARGFVRAAVDPMGSHRVLYCYTNTAVTERVG